MDNGYIWNGPGSLHGFGTYCSAGKPIQFWDKIPKGKQDKFIADGDVSPPEKKKKEKKEKKAEEKAVKNED